MRNRLKKPLKPLKSCFKLGEKARLGHCYVSAATVKMDIDIHGQSLFMNPVLQRAEISLSASVGSETLFYEFDIEFETVKLFNDRTMHLIVIDSKLNDFMVLYSCYEKKVGAIFYKATEYAWLLHRSHTLDPEAIVEVEQRFFKTVSAGERAVPAMIWTWKQNCNYAHSQNITAAW